MLPLVWVYNYTMGRRSSVDYIGKRFGRLTVTAVASPDKNRHIRLECLCDCGNTHVALAGNIRRGSTTSCGCVRRERSSEWLRKSKSIAASRRRRAEQLQSERLSLIGKKFGRLTVVELLIEGKKIRYRCECECGKEATTTKGNLDRGHTKSCGCMRFYRHPERCVGLRKLLYRYRQSAKRRGLLFEIELDKFRELTSLPCHYCGTPPTCIMKSRSEHSEYRYNGLDRVSALGNYSQDNVVPCCAVCNRMKSDLTTEEFEKHIRRIACHLMERTLPT